MPILKRNGKTFSGTPTKVDTAKSYTTFDSADDKNPTTWSDVELLTSKEEQRSLFSKISTMFKNIRYLYKILGTTDISNIGDGTVTGAVKAACDKADANEAATADVNNKLGSTNISAIGDGTVTSGLSVLSNNAYDLKMLGWTVPKECPVQNYVDENGVFHQIVGRVDLSKLMWEWADTLNEFRTDRYIMGMNLDSTNIYCSKYQFGSEMYISGMGIYIKDPNYDSSTISQFKADNKGVYFYYELATEITKPVDGNEAIKLLNDKLGNTNISAIGDGTVTGGLNALNSNLDSKLEIKAVSDTTQSDAIKVIENNWTSKPLDSGIWRVDTSSYTYTAYITNYGANYGEAFLTSYSLSNPIYGILSGGAWTWSEISTNSNLIILEASTQVDMTANRELDDSTQAITIPSGYKPIAMYAYNSNNNDNVSAVPLLIRTDGRILYHAKNHSASDQGVIEFVIRITFKRM